MKKGIMILALTAFQLLGVANAHSKAKDYPLRICIVSDEKLGSMGKPVYVTHMGQSYGFCCKPCVKKFRKDSIKFQKKFRAAVQKAKAKPYPLKNCIVSDEKLGSMGKPVYLIYKGQTYALCCKPCIKKFKKTPKKFRAKLTKLAKKNKK